MKKSVIEKLASTRDRLVRAQQTLVDQPDDVRGDRLYAIYYRANETYESLLRKHGDELVQLAIAADAAARPSASRRATARLRKAVLALRR